MAETVADLQNQLENLNAARTKGVKTITYTANGVSRSLEYKDDVQMQQAQYDLIRRINALQGNPPSRTVILRGSKGLCDRDQE